jgi:hypothetical protein
MSVFDELGYPVFVKSVGPVERAKVYRVGFTNRSKERGSVLMTEGHGLHTWNRDAMREFTKSTGQTSVPQDWAEYEGKRWTLGEVEGNYLARNESNGTRKLTHVIPMSFPLILPVRDVPIPPYIMGLTIQLHDRWTGLMTCKERMWDWYEAQFAAAGYPVSRTKKRLKRYKPDADVTFSSGLLNRKLGQERAYNYSGQIPPGYMRGSAQQRMELLQGLLDISFSDINTFGNTNSMFNKRASVIVWCGKSEALKDQVLELVRSLGYSATAACHPAANSYTVSYTPVDNPYRYPKFRAELPDLTQLKRNTFTRFCWRVNSVEIEAEAEVRAFDVTSPSGLVTVSELFLPVAGGDK